MAFRIYTKTGDKGTTALFGGSRRSKADLRIEAYGTVDELNAHLGLLCDWVREQGISITALRQIQNELFVLGAMLATAPGKKLPMLPLSVEAVQHLEQQIDDMEAELSPLKNFILPGGAPMVSQAHIVRCVCRRAERLCVALSEQEEISSVVIQYLNRLSDFFFVYARHLARLGGVEEVLWK